MMNIMVLSAPNDAVTIATTNIMLMAKMDIQPILPVTVHTQKIKVAAHQRCSDDDGVIRCEQTLNMTMKSSLRITVRDHRKIKSVHPLPPFDKTPVCGLPPYPRAVADPGFLRLGMPTPQRLRPQPIAWPIFPTKSS